METNGLPYSAMFCTNQKNAFLFRKSSVLIPNCQSYSSEKQRKSNIFSLLYICCPSCGRNPKALPLLIPCRSILYLSLPVGGAVCWQVCLYACLPAGRSVGKQARWQDGRQAGWSAGRLAGQRAYAYMLLFIAPFFCCFITTLIDGCIVPPIYIIQTPPL